MEKIILPKGVFNICCYECIYANFNDKDDQERIKCAYFDYYVDLNERSDCFHFKFSDDIKKIDRLKLENNSIDNKN